MMVNSAIRVTIGNLKLAFIAAAKLDSIDDVHFVRNLAQTAAANGVISLCDKFLVQRANRDSDARFSSMP
jgi:hypothetical protein